MNAACDNGRIAALTLPADTSRLKLVRAVVEQAALLAGCEAALIERLVLAVNEACMNIIQHGYDFDPQGEIRLEIDNNGEALVFRLDDDAAPVAAATLQPRPRDALRPGGLGLHLIHEVMDTVQHLPGTQGGNRLLMTKRLP